MPRLHQRHCKGVCRKRAERNLETQHRQALFDRLDPCESRTPGVDRAGRIRELRGDVMTEACDPGVRCPS